MGDFHACVFEGYTGYYNPNSGRVKLGNRLFPDIKVAVKYLGKR
jgi:hypothetical protein